MAIQEFDRPLRRTRQRSSIMRDYYLPTVLFLAGSIAIMLLSLPKPAGQQPLEYRSINEMPIR